MDLEELVDKWQDVLSCADSYEEKNLISEFLEDLRDIRG